ncbi:beta-glucosidase 22-like [Aristolochia californica]|uniref:beta-glucosidase 22-like n=1 Tax=Aristolochia californica TaxID=171875 RepID=UPI0035D54ACF
MMKVAPVFLLFLLLALREVGYAQTNSVLSRKDFPPYFVFGAGSSAYQVEGAVSEDGRSPSIWDIATHSGRFFVDNADVAADQYHKYMEDVKLMTDTGLDAYRMSISWSRLLPNGRGAINTKGLEYYNNLINELTDYGIDPRVTLYHLDHPQVLEDEYGGWLSPKMVEDFTAFADICFREFGDRVSYWTTINEPNVFALGAYDNGFLAPQRCSEPFGFNCVAGNSTVEPYIVVHHTLLGHASVAALYREKYLAKQHGWIGLNVYAIWVSPLSNSTSDALAAQRTMDFYNGWILSPLVFGDYPKCMKKNVGSRLPSFTEFQTKQIKGSFDFIGLNHYLTFYAEDNSNGQKPEVRDFSIDISANFTFRREDAPSGQVVPFNMPKAPWGLQSLLENIKQSYGNPPVFIEENGYGQLNNETLNDTARVDYITAYLNATLNAIRNGSNTRGYILWSFLDVFELLGGYRQRYGLYHVDFEDENLKRTPKYSAHWFSNFLKRNEKQAKIEKVGLERESGVE